MTYRQAVERALVSGELDPFDFSLAHELGMSLGQVRALPNSEVIAWQAYFTWRAVKLELEAKT